jgi:AcrR family transcriptional regulator
MPTTLRPAAGAAASRRKVAPRWRRAAPAQERSRETMTRFAEAAEALLREKSFEEISIQDIVRRARRPIGSFYARFGSKDALLPYLYDRYDESLEAYFKSRIARVTWDALDFPAAMAAAVDLLTGMYDERRWLLRALVLFARLRPEALPDDVVERRRLVFDPLVLTLARHRRKIRHADPEAALRFGIFMVSSVLREKLLFGHAPHSRVTPITRAELREELVHALTAYLASESSR